jgi:hypothetical protein
MTLSCVRDGCGMVDATLAGWIGGLFGLSDPSIGRTRSSPEYFSMLIELLVCRYGDTPHDRQAPRLVSHAEDASPFQEGNGHSPAYPEASCRRNTRT